MEPPNKTTYDCEFFTNRLNKVEDSLNKLSESIKLLTVQMKKNQNSPFMRVVNAICNVVDFVLKPITWLISFCLTRRNIKLVEDDATLPKPINTMANIHQ